MPGKKLHPFPYEDIVGLPRPELSRHRPLSQEDRAAQFAPFAALSGHEELMDETARLTDAQIELAPDAQAELDSVLRQLCGLQEHHPKVTVTFFQPDGKKTGGAYITTTQRLLRLDGQKQSLLLGNGRTVPFHRLHELHLAED